MAEFSIDTIMKEAAHRSIPILTLDERYNIVMPDKDKTPRIRKLESKVQAILKKQGKVTNDIKEIRKIKQKLMKTVVDNMDAAESEDIRQAKMSKAQQLIQESKEKLSELEEQELELPHELREANMELLMEFVKINYQKLNENREDIQLLDKWINDTRVELKKRLLIKQEKELKNNNIYAYMHDLLGPDLIEMFDEVHSE
jgi:paraquat-inducible protein B